MKLNPKIGGMIRRAIPLVLAMAICAWMVHAATWVGLAESVGRARFDYFIPLSLAYIVLSFYLECAGLWILILKSVMTAPLKEVILVRAVTQFIGSVNLWISQLGMAFHYSRRSGLPMSYMAGVNALQVFVDLGCAFLFCGMIFKPSGGQFDVAIAVTVGVGIAMFPALLFARTVSRMRLGDMKDQSVWFTKTGFRQIFAPLILMPYPDLMLLFVSRMLRYPLRALYLVLTLWTFNVDVPLAQGLVAAAFTVMIGSIPLTPQGLGLIQVAGLGLLGGFGTAADVLAALFMISMVQFMGGMIFGLYYLRGGMALIHGPEEPK